MFMESWESYHGHRDPAMEAYVICTHCTTRDTHTNDSEGVDEHHDDPVHGCNLNYPDYDGDPGSPPSSGARDNEVKALNCGELCTLVTLPLGGVQ